MRKDMRELKKNNKGFMLAELLIVVAIIAVLVAVSVPMFNGQLSKAREATNKANIRAAQAAAVATYLSNSNTDSVIYKYDLSTGTVTEVDSASGEPKTIDNVGGETQYDTFYVTVTATGSTVHVSKASS